MTDTSSYETADQKIKNLVARLVDKRVCPCCTARALAFHAAALAELEMGSTEAIKMLEEMVSALREHAAVAPVRGPSTAWH